MATHSIILAWEISWTKEPGRLQSMVLQSWTQLSDSTTTMLQYYLELQYYLPLLFRRHRYSGEAMSMVGRKKDITPRLTLYQEMLFLPAARPCCSDWTFSFLVSTPPPPPNCSSFCLSLTFQFFQTYLYILLTCHLGCLQMQAPKLAV